MQKVCKYTDNCTNDHDQQITVQIIMGLEQMPKIGATLATRIYAKIIICQVPRLGYREFKSQRKSTNNKIATAVLIHLLNLEYRAKIPVPLPDDKFDGSCCNCSVCCYPGNGSHYLPQS